MNTQRYLGYALQVAAVGDMSFVELWNAATSGKVIKVTRLEILPKDTAMSFWHHTAQQGASGTVGVSGNRNLGGAAPSVALYGEEILTTVLGTKIYTFTTVADAVKILDFENAPLIINPGKSLIIANDNVNLAITRAMIQWHEINATY